MQGSGYRAYGMRGYGRGAYTVVTTHEVETKEQFKELATFPLIEAVAPVNRLLLPEHFQSDKDLRQAAARLHADMLLVYTLDTDFFLGSNPALKKRV